MELEKLKFASGRKPPLHPGPRWWDRRWIAKQLRSNKSHYIKSTYLGFLKLVKFDYKLKVVNLSYDFELLLDLAELVLTKYHSKRHQHHSSLYPKDYTLPFYHIKLMGKLFAEKVQLACGCKGINNVWWPFDFTSYLVRLVLNKLRPDTSTATPKKKLKRPPARLCVDHGPLPVDRPPVPACAIHHDDPMEIDIADTPSASNKKLKRPFVDHDVDALPFKKLKVS